MQKEYLDGSEIEVSEGFETWTEREIMEIGVRERELKIISVSKNFCNFLPRITFSFRMQKLFEFCLEYGFEKKSKQK